MPATTRAVRIERFGGPGVLVERDVALPDPGPGEIRIAVEAAGVNFADLLMRAGLYATRPPLPFSPGFEVAGRVSATGPGVAALRDGDRALAVLPHGGYARDVVVPQAQVLAWPGNLSPALAAATPVAFLTAWVALHRTASVRRGETVLVLGAGGGVGTAAVQLAARHGLRVYGTAGTADKRAFVVRDLGAAGCFDSLGAWEAEVRDAAGDRGVDVALDAVGGRATASCRRLLAPLGRLVLYGLSAAVPGTRRSPLRAALAWLRTPRFHPLSLVEPSISIGGVHLLHLGPKVDVLREAWDEIAEGIAGGALRAVLDRTFPLDAAGAAAAHARLHARANLGKVVLVA